MLRWLPDEKNIEHYLERVRKVLEGAAEQVLSKNNLDEKYHDWFRLLVSATAWQESCWRQLVTFGDKIRFLLSHDGSSVGLMQINVRVWRGLYQPRSLRWNIHYNALAGSEILALYLRRQVLESLDPDRPPPFDVLGGAVYAMYRGGPNQFSLFMARQRAGRLNSFDRLFLEKYGWVEKGRLELLQKCIGGK